MILTFVGFVTTYSNLSVVGVITATTLGSVFGAIILYMIGRLLHADSIESFKTRWHKYL